MITNTEQIPAALAAAEARILQEGYGPGAWHGPDFKAALADVTPTLAFWRPGAGRHSIAEIALHHAFYVRSVRAQVTDQPAEPFVLEGEDWFQLDDETRLSWARITRAVESEQQRLADAIAAIGTGKTTSPMKNDERFALVLGITCHAVYHAGQVQLIKRLHGEAESKK
jgi:hypothetical protein